MQQFLGSEDLNESLVFAWTADTSGDRPVVSSRLFAAALLIGC